MPRGWVDPVRLSGAADLIYAAFETEVHELSFTAWNPSLQAGTSSQWGYLFMATLSSDT